MCKFSLTFPQDAKLTSNWFHSYWQFSIFSLIYMIMLTFWLICASWLQTIIILVMELKLFCWPANQLLFRNVIKPRPENQCGQCVFSQGEIGLTGTLNIVEHLNSVVYLFYFPITVRDKLKRKQPSKPDIKLSQDWG